MPATALAMIPITPLQPAAEMVEGSEASRNHDVGFMMGDSERFRGGLERGQREFRRDSERW